MKKFVFFLFFSLIILFSCNVKKEYSYVDEILSNSNVEQIDESQTEINLQISRNVLNYNIELLIVNGNSVAKINDAYFLDLNINTNLIINKEKIQSYVVSLKKFDESYINYLTNLGIIYGYYLPENSIIIKITNDFKVKKLKYIDSYVEYQPFMKMSGSDGELDDLYEIKVVLWSEEYSESFKRICESNDVEIVSSINNVYHVKGGNLKEIIISEDVLKIEKWYSPSVFSLTGNSINQIIFPSSVDMVSSSKVAIYDFGFDISHKDINDAYGNIYDLAGDGNTGEYVSHGTHIAGIIGGRGNSSSGLYTGVNSMVNFEFFAMGDTLKGLIVPPTMHGYFELAINNEAYIANLSWGTFASVRDGQYLSISRDIDEFVYNNPELLVIAAVGNDGYSIASPATAKNVISVGALNGNNIAEYSGRGYCSDGRYKPEITVQGTGIYSLDINNSYTELSGTSQSAAIVSGIISYLRSFIIDRYQIMPTHSLIKSLLIANTFNDNQKNEPIAGWGYGKLIITKDISSNHYILKNYNNDDIDSINFSVTNGDNVKIVLSWTEPPAYEMSIANLINDYDLKITDAYGNIFEAKDRVNNNEVLLLTNCNYGNYTLSILDVHSPYSLNDISITIKSELGFIPKIPDDLMNETVQFQYSQESHSNELVGDNSENNTFSDSQSSFDYSLYEKEETSSIVFDYEDNTVFSLNANQLVFDYQLPERVNESDVDAFLDLISTENENVDTQIVPNIYLKQGSNSLKLQAIGISSGQLLEVVLGDDNLIHEDVLLPVNPIYNATFEFIDINLTDLEDLKSGDLKESIITIRNKNTGNKYEIPINIMVDNSPPYISEKNPKDKHTNYNVFVSAKISDDQSGVSDMKINVNGTILEDFYYNYNYGNKNAFINLASFGVMDQVVPIEIEFTKLVDGVGNKSEGIAWKFYLYMTNDLLSPEAPTNIRFEFVDDRHLSVDWDAVSDSDIWGYNIYRISSDYLDQEMLNSNIIETNHFEYDVLALDRLGVSSLDIYTNESDISIVNVEYEYEGYPPEIEIYDVPEKTNDTVLAKISIFLYDIVLETNVLLNGVKIEPNWYSNYGIVKVDHEITNKLKVEIVDLLTNQYEQSIEFCIDKTSPNPVQNINYSIEDEYVIINWLDYQYGTSDFTYSLYFNSILLTNNIIGTNVRIILPDYGKNTIAVSVVDKYNNMSSKKYLYLDTEKGIQFNTKELIVDSDFILDAGIYISSNDYDIIEVSISNRNYIYSDDFGKVRRIYQEYETDDFPDGEYSVKISAVDIDGWYQNVTEYFETNLVIDHTPPGIKFYDGDKLITGAKLITTNNSILVRIEDSNFSILDVGIQGSKQYQYTSEEVTYNIYNNLLNIEVTAKDKVNMESTRILQIEKDTTIPTIDVTNLNGYLVGEIYDKNFAKLIIKASNQIVHETTRVPSYRIWKLNDGEYSLEVIAYDIVSNKSVVTREIVNNEDDEVILQDILINGTKNDLFYSTDYEYTATGRFGSYPLNYDLYNIISETTQLLIESGPIYKSNYFISGLDYGKYVLKVSCENLSTQRSYQVLTVEEEEMVEINEDMLIANDNQVSSSIEDSFNHSVPVLPENNNTEINSQSQVAKLYIDKTPIIEYNLLEGYYYNEHSLPYELYSLSNVTNYLLYLNGNLWVKGDITNGKHEVIIVAWNELNETNFSTNQLYYDNIPPIIYSDLVTNHVYTNNSFPNPMFKVKEDNYYNSKQYYNGVEYSNKELTNGVFTNGYYQYHVLVWDAAYNTNEMLTYFYYDKEYDFFTNEVPNIICNLVFDRIYNFNSLPDPLYEIDYKGDYYSNIIYTNGAIWNGEGFINGYYDLKIMVWDESFNTNQMSVGFYYDNQSPIIRLVITNNQIFNRLNFPSSFFNIEDDSKYSYLEYINDLEWEGEALETGTHEYRLLAWDYVYNSNQVTNIFIYDEDEPQINISLIENEYYNEETLPNNLYQITDDYSNGVISYLDEIIWNNDSISNGYYEFKVLAWDIADNSNEMSVSFYYDNDKPKITSYLTDGYYYNYESLPSQFYSINDISPYNYKLYLNNEEWNGGLLTTGLYTNLIRVWDRAYNSNEISNFYYYDNVSPKIVWNIETNLFYNTNTIQKPLFNLFDDYLLSSTVEINGTNWDEVNYNFENGKYEVIVSAIDHSSNMSIFSNKYNIDNYIPTITFNITNNEYYNHYTLPDELFAIGESNIKNYTAYLNYSVWDEIGLNDGDHHLVVTVEDEAGNTNAQAIDFVYDTNSPSIQIYINDSQYTNSFNNDMYAYSDANLNTNTVDIKINGIDIDSYTMIEGSHELSIYLEDLSGLSNYESVIFYYDITKPQIISGREPGYYYSTDINFDIIDDQKLDYYHIVLNTVNYETNQIISLSSNGIYTIHIDSKDSAGNNNDAIYTYIIDQSKPVIDINLDNGMYYETNTIPMISITDDYLSNSYSYLNGGLYTNQKITHIGSNHLYVYAIDKAGNEHYAERSFFIADGLPSIEVTGVQGLSIGDVLYLSNNINLHAFVTNGIEVGFYSVLSNIITHETQIGNHDVIINDEGEYKLKYFAVAISDISTNSTNIITWQTNFIVDKFGPVINVNGFSNTYYSQPKITCSISMSDHLVSNVITLYSNNSILSQSSSLNSIVDVIWFEGDYEYSMYAEDVFGRSAFETIPFVLDITYPRVFEVNDSGSDDAFSIDSSSYVLTNRIYNKDTHPAFLYVTNLVNGSYYSYYFATNTNIIELILDREGNNKLLITASDLAGNTTNIFKTNLIDYNSPVFEINNFDTNKYYYQLSPINASVDVMDISLSRIGVEYYSNVTIENYTMYTNINITDISSTNYRVNFDSENTNDGYYRLKITAKDNIAQSLDLIFDYVIDSTSPVITHTGMTNGDVMIGSDGKIMFNVYDLYLSNIYVYVEGPGINFALDTNNTNVEKDLNNHGIYTNIVYAVDYAGNIAAITNTNIRIDNLPPEININGVSDGDYTSNTINLLVEVTDDSKYRYDLSISNLTKPEIIYLSSLISPYSNTFSVDGDYIVSVIAYDEVGNTLVNSISFTIDKTPPGIVFQNATNNQIFKVAQFDFSMDITDLSDCYIMYTNYFNESKLSFDSLTNPDYVKLSLTQEGHYQMYVTAIDSAGNKANSNINYYIDRTPPSITFKTNNSIVDNGSQNIYQTWDGSFTVSVNATDEVCGISRIRVFEEVNAGIIEETIFEGQSNATVGTYVLENFTNWIDTSAHQATRRLFVIAEDSMGNTNVGGDYEIWYGYEDTIAPMIQYTPSLTNYLYKHPLETDFYISNQDYAVTYTVYDNSYLGSINGIMTPLAHVASNTYESGFTCAEGEETTRSIGLNRTDIFGNNNSGFLTKTFAIDKKEPELVWTSNEIKDGDYILNKYPGGCFQVNDISPLKSMSEYIFLGENYSGTTELVLLTTDGYYVTAYNGPGNWYSSSGWDIYHKTNLSSGEVIEVDLYNLSNNTALQMGLKFYMQDIWGNATNLYTFFNVYDPMKISSSIAAGSWSKNFVIYVDEPEIDSIRTNTTINGPSSEQLIADKIGLFSFTIQKSSGEPYFLAGNGYENKFIWNDVGLKRNFESGIYDFTFGGVEVPFDYDDIIMFNTGSTNITLGTMFTFSFTNLVSSPDIIYNYNHIQQGRNEFQLYNSIGDTIYINDMILMKRLEY